MGETTGDEKTYILNSKVSLSNALDLNKSFSLTEAFYAFWNYRLGVQVTELFIKRTPLNVQAHKVNAIEVKIDRDIRL